MLAGHEANQANFHGLTADMVCRRRADFGIKGALIVATGTMFWIADANYTILGTLASVGTAPTGADLILDIKKNASTIYTTTANRPKITAGTTKSTLAFPAPDVKTLVLGDLLSMDVAQIGSTVAGSDLQGGVILYRTP